MRLHYATQHNTTLHCLHPQLQLQLRYFTLNYMRLHYTTLPYIALHYTHYTATNTPATTLHYLHDTTTTGCSTTLQVQLQLQYATLHPTVVGEATTASIATTPENTTPTTFRSISGFAPQSVIHKNQPLL